LNRSSRLTESYWPADTTEDLWDLSVGDLLRKVAGEVPDRLALVEGIPDRTARRRWTYAQMLAIAEQVARALLARFQPGERVALFAANCPEWVLLQHGVSLAGMVLVPINPAYKAAEVDVLLRSSKAAGIFHADVYRDNDLRRLIAEIQPRLPLLREVVSLSDWNAFIHSGDAATPLPFVAPEQMVLIQYTSGTTGIPKGACLHHRGVINTSRQVARRAGFEDGDIWVNAMPLFHIGGSVVTELGTITSRGTYVIMPGFDPAQMLEVFESERGNATLIVPTMILNLLEHPAFPNHDLSSIKTILSGASAVPAALVHRTKEALGCQFTILFGQTELNGVVCQTRVNDSIEDQSDTLGQPLPQVEVKIACPETGEVRPIGVAGEIYARGYQVMQGYFGMDEATQATIEADGWLHTGDLGAMDERGYLRITGRLKDMIIRGGINIYPREIEDALFDHPEVNQAAVIGVPDEKWGEVIAAIILPNTPQNPPSASDLFAYCRNKLAAHKAPTLWYFVDAYPLTPSGKIQKFKLQEWATSGVIKPVVWERPASASNRV
jgi:fatty-acyl-CoA synthase